MSTKNIGSMIGVTVLFSACAFLYFFHSLSYPELVKDFVLGVDGVEMESSDDSVSARFMPWEPLEQNLPLDAMLEQLCVKSQRAADCYKTKTARFRIFTQEHVLNRPDATRYSLERNTVPISIADLTPAFLDARIELIANWALANVRADGSLPYVYLPSSDTYPQGDYIIRQLLTVQGLFAIAEDRNDAALRAIAERTESYLFSTYERHTTREGTYMTDVDGSAPLGDTALAVLMIRAHEKGAPLTAREKNFGKYIVSMQRADGSFQTFLGTATSTQDEKFYSGEALMALAELESVEHDDRYTEALQKGFEYYRAKLENDFEPQYTPWHMQAFAKAFQITGRREFAEYVYWLADGLIETMLNHDPYALADEKGRFFNPEYPAWGPPHSASTSIYVEGLTYAYEVARAQGDTARANRYKKAILAGTRSLLLVQWTPESAYYVMHPERVIGSFKVTITDNRGRIDQTGHTANALVRVKEIVAQDETSQ